MIIHRVDHQISLFITTLFAIAMAFLESAIVVYLRLIYYPGGFSFPLIEIPSDILVIEILREAATIIMLLTVSWMLARNRREWFAFFAYNFGVWDIFYYIWLKVFLNWPDSVFDWDVLFLIPLPWTGPVLAPVIVSVLLIMAAVLLLVYQELKLSLRDWILEIIAGLIIIISFLFQLKELESGQHPQDYPWSLFVVGCLLGLGVFFNRLRGVMFDWKRERNKIN